MSKELEKCDGCGEWSDDIEVVQTGKGEYKDLCPECKGEGHTDMDTPEFKRHTNPSL
jgi:hypothetical protein